MCVEGLVKDHRSSNGPEKNWDAKCDLCLVFSDVLSITVLI